MRLFSKRNLISISLILLVLLAINVVIAIGRVNIVSVVPVNGINVVDPGNSITFNVTLDNPDYPLTNQSIAVVNLNTTITGPSSISSPSISNVYSLTNIPQLIQFAIGTTPTTLPGTYNANLLAFESGNLSNQDTQAYSFVVNSKPQMSLSTVTIKTHQAENKSGTFVITNTGNIPLNLNIFPNITLTDNDNDTIALSLNQTSVSIPVSGSASIGVSVNVPATQDQGVYSGDLQVTGTLTASSSLTIKVLPELCSNGEQGNNIVLNIEDPDAGQDFYPGQTIDTTVNVENKDTEDMTVVVRSLLYDIKDEETIKSAKEIKTISSESNDDVTLSLAIPYRIKESTTRYFVLSYAYEEDNQDNQCKEADVNIDMKRNTHDVVITSASYSPSTVECGEEVSALVHVLNIGKEDESDTRVSLVNSELGLDLVSDPFNLDKYGDAYDEKTENFRFTIPTSATGKDYSITSTVRFSDTSYQNTSTLHVNCVAPTAGNATLGLTQTSFTAVTGSSFTVPAVVTNNLNTQKTYTLELSPAGDWASTVIQTISLNAKQSGTFYLTSNVGATATSGLHSGTVYLKLDGNILDSKTFSVDVSSGAPLTTGGVTFEPISEFKRLLKEENLSTIFWIIGDIVLIIVALYFIRLLVTRR